MKDVIDNIRQLKRKGAKEIVLTGINLGAYGQDLPPENGRLIDLLYRIENEDLIDRVRLSSLEPLEISTDIVRFTAESKNACRHFHIPLQSGDDQVLKKMHRPYTPPSISSPNRSKKVSIKRWRASAICRPLAVCMRSLMAHSLKMNS